MVATGTACMGACAYADQEIGREWEQIASMQDCVEVSTDSWMRFGRHDRRECAFSCLAAKMLEKKNAWYGTSPCRGRVS